VAEVDEELPEEVPVLCVVPWVVFPSGSVGVLELPPPPPPQETNSASRNAEKYVFILDKILLLLLLSCHLP
jgi:hypothetical protein